MYRSLLLAIAISCSLTALAAASHTIGSRVFGKDYSTTITDEVLRETGDWREDEENPRLSAQKAKKLASKLRETLVPDSDEHFWLVKSVSIERLIYEGKWIWVVTFEAWRRQPTNILPAATLQIVVLMDGTVIQPTVSPAKKSPNSK